MKPRLFTLILFTCILICHAPVSLVSSEPYPHSFETDTGYTSDGDSIDLSQKGWSPLTLVKNVDGLDLVFTINLPKPSPYDTDDTLWLYLDYDADDATDAFIACWTPGKSVIRSKSYFPSSA